MRINSPAPLPYVVELSRPAAKAAPRRAPEKGYDRVELSARSRELAKLKKDLDALPEVRLDRVALARQQMQYGPYRVDPVLLAGKILSQQPLQGDEP